MSNQSASYAGTWIPLCFIHAVVRSVHTFLRSSHDIVTRVARRDGQTAVSRESQGTRPIEAH